MLNTRGRRVTRLLFRACVVGTTCGSLSVTAVGTASAAGLSGSNVRSPVSDGSVNCHGCGDGKTVTVWVEAVTETTAQQTKWQNYVAKQFKANTGATVKFTTMSTGTEVLNAIEQGAATNTGPDVLDTANSYNGEAEAAKIYKPITNADWQLIGGKSRFTPGVLSYGYTGGNTVDWYLHTDLLAYNTKLFHEAGISGPPKTWAQYVADGERITKLGHGIYGVASEPPSPYGPWHDLYTITRDMGGNWVNGALTKATLDTPTVAKAVEFWFSWYKDGFADPQSLSWTGNQEQALFIEGKLGMENQVNSSLITSAQGTSVAKDIAFAPMPTVPVGDKALPSGAPKYGVPGFNFAYTLGVPRWASDPSLAYRFIQVATSEKAELLLYNLTASLPTTVGAGNVVSTEYPLIKPFIKYASEAVVAPYYPFWGSVENAVSVLGATLARDYQNGSYSDSAVQTSLIKANSTVQAAMDATASSKA